MWAIRVLTGPQAGQIFDLNMGRNVVGRAAHCDVKLTSSGVSKEHVEIVVSNEKLQVTDLKSSNGTFLNGVRLQSGILRLGDKLGVHDILVDIVPASNIKSQTAPTANPMSPLSASASRSQGQHATRSHYHQHSQHQPTPQVSLGANGYGGEQGAYRAQQESPTSGLPGHAPSYHPGGFSALQDKFSEYINQVALPGVYRLPTLVEFKLVLLGFILIFIFTTTLFSMVPMVAISRASVLSEAKRRAASLARTVATLNSSALLQNNYSTLSTNQVESEDGVKQVLIVQQSDGMILAPATRAGTTPDLPFVHTARREMRPQTVEIDPITIGASFPIGQYDPNTGEQTVRAHAIILYDVSSLSFDDGRAISLFMQTLVISTFLGLIVFYFMYKMIEYPILSLNSQLDIAMREKKDSTEVTFIFPALQSLAGNINSLLSRYVNGVKEEGGASGNFANKEGEAENLVQMIGYPALAIARDGRVIGCNQSFGQVARTEPASLIGQIYTVIPDVSLQQNIENLVTKSLENSRVVQTDQLEFSGHLCILSCQAMSSGPTEIDYFLITVSPIDGGAG